MTLYPTFLQLHDHHLPRGAHPWGGRAPRGGGASPRSDYGARRLSNFVADVVYDSVQGSLDQMHHSTSFRIVLRQNGRPRVVDLFFASPHFCINTEYTHTALTPTQAGGLHWMAWNVLRMPGIVSVALTSCDVTPTGPNTKRKNFLPNVMRILYTIPGEFVFLVEDVIERYWRSVPIGPGGSF